MVNKITLTIPKELKQKLEENMKGTNFESIQEYILFMLEQMTSKVITKREKFNKEDQAYLKQGLEDMGYLG